MLELIKLALKIYDNDHDAEIEELIVDALSDIKSRGGEISIMTGQLQTAVVFYCKWKWGDGDDRYESMYEDVVKALSE